MDVQIPVIDSHTATQKLREHGYQKPIIAKYTSHQFGGIASFHLSSGGVIETQFLEYGHLRSALKLGHRKDGTPAIFLEKDYFQTHPYQNWLRAQHKRLLEQIAQDGGFEINGHLVVGGSQSVAVSVDRWRQLLHSEIKREVL